ncbi:Guanine nucleotide exchange factor lte1 [Cryomyces antarcticus]|nr:Guanine nucleotide exchange factor lte1 [Cryomyces antarcticus]
MSPPTLTSKNQARPLHQHKRSGSFSDALRDTRASRPTSHISSKGVPLTFSYPLAGTLIRGVMISPMAPFVDVVAPKSPTTGKGVPASRGSDTANASAKAPVTSTPRVKTLFGTMRRALSSGQGMSRYPVRSENFTSLSCSNAASAPRSVVQRQDSRQELARTEVRMDLLAVRVIASFHETLKLDNPLGQESIVNDHRTEKPEHQQGTAVPDGGEKVQKVPEHTRLRNSVTAGGSSVAVIDDTALFSSPKTSGDPAVSEANTSLLYEGHGILLGNSSRVRDHAGHNVHTSTERDLGSKRDSQYLHGVPPVSEVQGFDHVAETLTERVATVRLPAVRTRNISSRSVSSGSASLRRYASFQSGMVKHSKDRSLDTISAASVQRHTSDTHAFQYDQSLIRRQLRRRPGGGDLRAVENVHHLGPITRPRSTGSLSNPSHSVTNSAVYDFSDAAGHVEASKAWRNSSFDISIGRRRRKSPSLMDTHSSQPNLRPSFEAEVAKLATLTDDDEEGGIESALLKLEGRYEKRNPKPRDAPQTVRVRTTVTSKDIHEEVSRRDEGRPVLQTYTTPQQSRVQDISAMSHSNTSSDKPRVSEVTPSRQSEDSYSSIPLLERDLSDVGTKKRKDAKKTWSRVYVPMRAHEKSSTTQETSNSENSQAASSSPSMVYIGKTQSIERGAQARAATSQSLLHESFLLDDDQSLSGISTDLSTDVIDQSDSANDGLRSFFDDEPIDHEPYASFAPPTMQHSAIPPSSGERSAEPSPELNQRRFKLHAPVLPPLNQYSDVPHTILPRSFGAGAIGPDAVELAEVKEGPSPRSPVHIPFILAYESEVLAEQFTIVEKDALDEIDWREPMEVRWKQTSPSVRNWVEYLRDEEPHGVEVVIARFNIVVKWALSECVMTEDIDERVKCIVRYIHIAAHARRLRNYATMYQITIALLSSDCSRLTRTWALVPQTDKQILKGLEALVQPLRNFKNLRQEMESATVEEGCIPFIGIYTHDLIYNAQKPASFPSPVLGGEPLINFERHRTSAMIVKNLLRLLEASSKYNFQPDRTILSRCLWVATLDDEEISARSRKLE